MPLFDDTMEVVQAGNNFGYSAVKLDNLGSSQYTLATIAVDVSGSVSPFRSLLEGVLKSIIQTLRKDPRADSMMLRVIAFNDVVKEIQGFKELSNCNESDFNGVLNPMGSTALNDAVADGIRATTDYAEKLTDVEYDCNGIVFVITDGCNNVRSTNTHPVLKKMLKDPVFKEEMNGMISYLVAVNAQDSYVKQYLDTFNSEVGFDQYIEIEHADAKSLAKLSGYVSKSVSLHSQSLQNATPSQALTLDQNLSF